MCDLICLVIQGLAWIILSFFVYGFVYALVFVYVFVFVSIFVFVSVFVFVYVYLFVTENEAPNA
jgi:hypothetical protein